MRLGRRWKRRDYTGDAEAIAQRLLGRVLVRRLVDGGTVAGRIVETEAYLGVIDRASHAFGGRRTGRNEAMYAGPGTAYVYFTYGMHFCFNVVCGEVGVPAAVLVRALEPVLGVDRMRALRLGRRGRTSLVDTDLCSGPAKLCQALAIDRDLNGTDLVRQGGLFVCEPAANGRSVPGRSPVVRTPRIGIGYAGEWAGKPLRFLAAASPHVSVPLRRGERRRGRAVGA